MGLKDGVMVNKHGLLVSNITATNLYPKISNLSKSFIAHFLSCSSVSMKLKYTGSPKITFLRGATVPLSIEWGCIIMEVDTRSLALISCEERMLFLIEPTIE